jgi:ketosteroid isomerase-like protein
MFIEAINRHVVDDILGLMTDDHRFTDSLGNLIEGRDNLKVPWQQYLAMFPDYEIDILETLSSGSVVAVFGRAKGSYEGAPENQWEAPAAWRAEVKDGRISTWQVYCDNEPVRQILRRLHDA